MTQELHDLGVQGQGFHLAMYLDDCLLANQVQTCANA